MFCTQCGRRVRPGTKFCRFCGAVLRNLPASTAGEVAARSFWKGWGKWMTVAAIVIVVGVGAAVGVLYGRGSNPESTTVASPIQASMTTTTTALPSSPGQSMERASLPLSAGRSQVLIVAPQAKSITVGETFKVRAWLSHGTAVYEPTTFTLLSDAPAVASAVGDTITATGSGSTEVRVEAGTRATTVWAEVFKDRGAFNEGGANTEPLPESPISTDGRISILLMDIEFSEGPGLWVLEGLVRNETDAGLSVATGSFALYFPEGVRYRPNLDSAFYRSSEEGESESNSNWTLSPGEWTSVSLLFDTQAGDSAKGVWLVFDDGESLIAIPADGSCPGE